MGVQSDPVEASHSTIGSSSAEECDAIIRSSDNIPFNAHKRILCDASELFEAFFCERWTDSSNAKAVYESKNIDSQCLQIIIEDIYGKEPDVPLEMLLPVLKAAQFLLLKNTRLQEYCVCVIAREPFAVLGHELFYEMIVQNSALVDRLLKTDILLTNETQLRKIFFSWPSDEAGFVDGVKKRLKKLSRIHREVVYFYDRSSGKVCGFTGNRSFQWLERNNLSFPQDVQHMVITDDALLYATSDEIRDADSHRAIYYESSDFKWPPLLRRYGKMTVWTEDNRRKIRVVWLGTHRQGKRIILNFGSQGTIARYIATADCQFYDHLVVVATQNGLWKVLMFIEIDKYNHFENLECPLKRIDGVAVLNNTVYAIGNETMGNASNKLLVYSEGKREWRFLRDRISETDIRAFFPLNGRLYVASNERDTCEVYEPAIDRWMVTDFYKMKDIAGFSLSTRADF